MKKIVVLTGAGMSVESGLKTFRDADGLWENYPVSKVATHEGWLADPTLVTNFYNMLRKKCWGVKPNEGHRLVAKLEEKYDVTVVTQNVDNLHEMAGSSKVIHLHGELMKVCSTTARWSLAPRLATVHCSVRSSSSSERRCPTYPWQQKKYRKLTSW